MADSSRRKSRATEEEKPAEETAPAAAEKTASDKPAAKKSSRRRSAQVEDQTSEAAHLAAEETVRAASQEDTPGAVSEGEYDYAPPATVVGAVQAPGATQLSPATRKHATSPGSAPLEPAKKDSEEEAEPPKVADIGVAFAAKANELFDEATGDTPDPESVFQPLSEHGSAQVCQVRLLERTYLGLHNNEITRVVMPEGAVISDAQAEQIKARLAQQRAK
ncbi:hypothetical protein ABN028_20090 [Actinopolymorpha sp. B17G11]|uniref:hypothetical protein n=1 Tax=Actinopolymorpha sp. B17G11 TaxID=3160861 RepID=UPI0032E3F75A